MGKKIFISYKYSDSNVAMLGYNSDTIARHYVDKIQEIIGKDHINKGEKDDESLQNFTDGTITSKLRDKIHDSSVTIVLISHGMKEKNIPEKDQWIPWEISYSLREQTRSDRTSRTNAILAVVLPDKNGQYSYFIEERKCQDDCACSKVKRANLFKILRDNMFNKKEPKYKSGGCPQDADMKIHQGASSYIHYVKWSDLIRNHQYHIDEAIKRQQDITSYKITKEV